MSERLVLCLDGATRVSSAALLRPRTLAGPHEDPGSLWEVAATRAQTDGRGQGKILLRAVDEMLSEMGACQTDIGAIVVGTGPGTFTGARIAVATGRALSLALSVPVVGVSTLAALAAEVARDAEASVLVPVVDARRGQLFYGSYKGLGDSGIPRWVRTAPFGVCDRDQIGAVVDSSALVIAEDDSLVGALPDGVRLHAAAVRAERLVFGQGLLVEPGDRPEGMRLTPWLIEALVAGKPPEPEVVKPIYVRAPDADIHITKMKDPWAPTAGSGDDRPGR